ncbi:uncharacterized protein [Zea mays]|uniref:Tubby-like F-box protein 2 n=1 Tax=Zea mays TaxID=4577 RepID=A0A1D6L3K8_MAIZE|nr:uncharacterized protein LOC103643982 [Zea mays]ONM09026.1 Tubby-like F-box protein 2 [Zea mays]
MLVFHKMTVQLMKIQRVESSETTWPARRQVVACAAVCWSWREVTKEVVKTLKECGRITFPMSLKQVFTFAEAYDFEDLESMVEEIAKAFKTKIMFIYVDTAEENLAKTIPHSLWH